MLPLRIGVEKPTKCYIKNPKLFWYEMGIRDIYIRNELARYFLKKKYTHRVGINKIKSQKYSYTHTNNGSQRKIIFSKKCKNLPLCQMPHM